MTEKQKADEVLNRAADKAAATLKGVNFSDTDAVLNEFNTKIDEASELASAKAKKSKQ
jgi:hypothetical protein